MSTTRFVLMSLLALPALYGCSKSDAPAPTPVTEQSPPAVVAEIAPPEPPQACDLVTSAEMSAIVGATVVGVEPGHKSSNKTECIYQPENAPSPYVEFSVVWGDGKIAMKSMGAMNRVEPGATDPYAGIGDQAVAIGTALFIRTGEDLVNITFSGVKDAPAKAKQIFDTAKARM